MTVGEGGAEHPPARLPRLWAQLSAQDFAVPDDEASRLALAQRTGAILLFVGGLVTLTVVPIAVVTEVPDFRTMPIAALALVALVSGPLVAVFRMSSRVL